MERVIESLRIEPLDDHEVFVSKSPVVSGQALTGAELHRRISAGLSVGCAVRSFDQISPYLDKFSVYDAIGNFRLRHGMVHSDELTAGDHDESPGENNSPVPDEELK